MKIAVIIVRTLIGLLLLFGAVVYFLKPFPVPAPTGSLKVYNDGLAVVNLMFYVKVIELICGLAFVTGKFNTLAAVVIFPILLNILLFHVVAAPIPASIGTSVFLVAGDLFIAYYYRKNYASLFKA